MRTTNLKLDVVVETGIKVVAISRSPLGLRVKLRIEGKDDWYKVGDEAIVSLCVNREEKRD